MHVRLFGVIWNFGLEVFNDDEDERKCCEVENEIGVNWSDLDVVMNIFDRVLLVHVDV
jgi:hypothetical protein